MSTGAVSISNSHTLNQLLELLEPAGQAVSIRVIFLPPRQLDHLPSDPFEAEFEERPIMNFEQAVGDMDSEIRVDPDQVGVEGGMVDLRQRQAIRDDRLAQFLVGIHDDMNGIEQSRLGQMGDRIAPTVGAQDGISKGCLVPTVP
jgi:hypothetical protein